MDVSVDISEDKMKLDEEALPEWRVERFRFRKTTPRLCSLQFKCFGPIETITYGTSDAEGDLGKELKVMQNL